MEPTAPAANPEPYREPRTGFGAVLRNRKVRRIGGAVFILGLLALADQSIVRTQSAPVCGRCCARFDETTWTLDVPLLGVTAPVSTRTSPRGVWQAAGLVGAEHRHSLQVYGTEETRGILVPRPVGGISCALYESFPGAFSRALDGSPEFAEFVRAALEHGDVARGDVAAAIEIVFGVGETGESIPDEERRIRDVANGLYAAWRGIPAAEADLWGPQGSE